MKGLDFLFYYFTYWFTENKDKLSWSSPIERSVYAIGLFTMFWLISIGEVIQFLMSKEVKFDYSLLPFLIIGLAIMQIYKYAYITKRRYESIISSKHSLFNISNDTGATMVIIFAFFSTLLPFVLFMVFN